MPFFRSSPLSLHGALAATLCLVGTPDAEAQGVATEQQLETVTVTGGAAPRKTLDPNLPNTTASKTAEDLREQQNIFNPEDALRNIPNTVVRKRYSGDRNALIGGRSFATNQAPRALVLMDGYLLSNFLGRFDAPRWNMLAPEEIARVDVFFGPFSAIYPGNSIGTTVAITTTRPKGFEASGRIAFQSQKYDLYGINDTYNNSQATVLLGNRLESGAWYRLMVNRQDSTSQPMQFYGVNANAAGVFTPPSTPGAAKPVTGITYDTAPNGRRRAIFGANAGAIDHTRQDTIKLSGGYDFSPVLTADAFVAWWRNDTRTRNATAVRDAAGNPVWSGRVGNDGNVFDIPRAAFAPYTRNEEHVQTGATLKTRNATGWNGSVVASLYRIGQDLQRNASTPDPEAALGGAGSGVARDGTGFRTFELQSTYTPTPGDWTDGDHALTFGLHANDYELKQSTFGLTDWRSSGLDNQTAFVGGKTSLVALYGQDAWRFAPNWRLTSGLRYESWKAKDGSQFIAGIAPLNYPQRQIDAVSPKLSLLWEPARDLTLRASYGRGTRFPTVSELFQSTQSGSRIERNDPNLQPEQSNAFELFAEKRFQDGTLRASIFQDDVRNTIWSQLDPATFPIVTTTQNVGRVRTRGIEFAGNWQVPAVSGLYAEGNIAFNRPVILENANFPASEGKTWVRIPRVRSAATLVYQPVRAWTFSGTYRYSGRQYDTIDNSDINRETYGGLSKLSQLDLRALWRLGRGTELAFGIDNVTDNRAYQSHPFPGRTLFAEVRQSF